MPSNCSNWTAYIVLTLLSYVTTIVAALAVVAFGESGGAAIYRRLAYGCFYASAAFVLLATFTKI